MKVTGIHPLRSFMGMILFGALQTICGADDPAPAVKLEKPISLAKWSQSLQKDVGKILPGKTKAEHEVVVAEHLAWFKENHSSAFVEFSVKVTEVRWRDGVAFISTTGELPANDRAIIVLSPRRYAFGITTDQTTATTIKPGTPVNVTARLHLTTRASEHLRSMPGTFTTTQQWQPFYNVENTRLKSDLGGYCSGDYSLEIAGKTYPGAWTDPPETEDAK